jgi:hypothetical protein
MIDTQPTTLPGLAALVACLRDNKMLREQIPAADDDYIHNFIPRYRVPCRSTRTVLYAGRPRDATPSSLRLVTECEFHMLY